MSAAEVLSALLVEVVRAGDEASPDASKGARTAVTMVVQRRPELRTAELHALLLGERAVATMTKRGAP